MNAKINKEIAESLASFSEAQSLNDEGSTPVMIQVKQIFRTSFKINPNQNILKLNRCIFIMVKQQTNSQIMQVYQLKQIN